MPSLSSRNSAAAARLRTANYAVACARTVPLTLPVFGFVFRRVAGVRLCRRQGVRRPRVDSTLLCQCGWAARCSSLFASCLCLCVSARVRVRVHEFVSSAASQGSTEYNYSMRTAIIFLRKPPRRTHDAKNARKLLQSCGCAGSCSKGGSRRCGSSMNTTCRFDEPASCSSWSSRWLTTSSPTSPTMRFTRCGNAVFASDSESSSAAGRRA